MPNVPEYNFTSSFLEGTKKRFVDDLGNEILTIHYIQKQIPLSLKLPILSYNFLEKKKKVMESKISITKDIKDLERYGFSLVAIPLPKEQRWNRMTVMYALVKKGGFEETKYKKFSIMPRNPENKVHIEVDEANRRLRLIGAKASPTGEGPWLEW